METNINFYKTFGFATLKECLAEIKKDRNADKSTATEIEELIEKHGDDKLISWSIASDKENLWQGFIVVDSKNKNKVIDRVGY